MNSLFSESNQVLILQFVPSDHQDQSVSESDWLHESSFVTVLLHFSKFLLAETPHGRVTSRLPKCAKFDAATYPVCFLLADCLVLSELEHSDGNPTVSYNQDLSLLLGLIYFQIFGHLLEQQVLHVSSGAVSRQIMVSRAGVISYILLQVQIPIKFSLLFIER